MNNDEPRRKREKKSEKVQHSYHGGVKSRPHRYSSKEEAKERREKIYKNNNDENTVESE